MIPDDPYHVTHRPPVRSEPFVRMLENRLARTLAPRKRGPKPKGAQEEDLFANVGEFG